MDGDGRDARSRTPWPVRPLGLLLLALGYWGLGRASLLLATSHVQASPVWAPTGFAIAAVFLWGRRVAPAVLAGAFLVNFTTSGHIPSSLAIAAGNTLEALLGGLLARRWSGPTPFETGGKALRFVAAAGILGPVASASIGTASLLFWGLAPASAASSIWFTWALGDTAGALLLTPLLLSYSRCQQRGWGAFAMLVNGLVAAALFLPPGERDPAWLLVLLPGLIWPALRLGPAGSSASLLATAGIAIAGTVIGRGLFVRLDPNESLLLLQGFLATAAITLLATSGHAAQDRVQGRHGWTTSAIALVTLLPLAGATVLGSGLAQDLEEELAQERFDQHIAAVQEGLAGELAAYEDLLAQTAGFLAATDGADAATFEAYVRDAHILERHSGIQAISYSTDLGPDGLADHVASTGHPVHPERPGAARHAVVTYISPLEGNEAALGLDLYFEERRAQALTRAAATGEIAATRPIILVQEQEDAAGLLLVQPVHTHSTSQLDVMGYAVVVLRVPDLMAAMLDRLEGTTLRPELEVHHDGALLYGSEGPGATTDAAASRTFQADVFGTTWLITLQRPPGLLSDTESLVHWGILAAGGAVSILLTVVVATASTTGQRARHMADRMTQELRQSKTRLAEAQAVARVGSWEWDVGANSIRWSDELYRLFGLAPDAFAATYEAYVERLHPDDRERVEATVGQAMQDHLPYTLDHRIRRPDGEVRWVHSVGRVEVDDQGRPTRLLGTAQDVTDQKTAELRFEALLESAPDAFLLADPEGTIVLVNEQAEQLFGYDRQELLGQKVEAIIPQRYHAAHKGHRKRYGDQPRKRPMGAGSDLRARRKDGSEFPVEISLSPIKTDGGTQVMAAVRDITERAAAAEADRIAFERLLEIQKLQEMDRFKTALLNTASHELNTPLTPLQLQLHLLRSGRLGDLDDRQEHALAIVGRNVDRLAHLVRDFLDVARLESHRLLLRPGPTDLGSLARTSIQSFEVQAERQDVTVTLTAPEDLGLTADPERLSQVLDNLLSNAIKFSPPGGTITIEAAPERHQEEDGLRVTFTDEGRGLSPEQKAKLFQPFSQAHAHQPDAPSGTGLGLYICKGIIEQHGGSLGVDSDGPDQGATFWFWVPLEPPVPSEG
ncbi:MAG: PAS domain S-box protein [Thermoplasmatota archaeon]